jgi:hypothetical protein
MEIKCIHCEKTMHASASAAAIDEQTMTMQIGFEGEFLSAETVWSTIKNMEIILKSCGKDMGLKTSVYIKEISQTDKLLSVKFFVDSRKK